MSGEWLKPTVSDLIATYKENENLYNPKNKLYYNKQARNKSLENILKNVQKTKSDTTINDVIKKIQILRTQFGQELNKIEKSKALGEDLTYVPKIWWFEKLKFVANFTKIRSSVKESTNDNTEETIYEVVEANENIEEEQTYDDEQDDSSKPKKRRIEITSLNEPDSQRTIEYIINEETSELNDQFHNITENEGKVIDSKHFKRKSKAFGQYVGCLMRELNDDKLFYETQNEILKVIEKASLKNVQHKN